MRTCTEKPHAARGCRNKKFLYPPLVASLIIAIKDRSIVFSELDVRMEILFLDLRVMGAGQERMAPEFHI